MTTTPPNATVTQIVEQLIREIGCIAPHDPAFHPGVDLFDTGYLDSLGLVTLTALLQQTFGTSLTEEDIFDPRFATPSGIADIVTERQARRDAAPT